MMNPLLGHEVCRRVPSSLAITLRAWPRVEVLVREQASVTALRLLGRSVVIEARGSDRS